MHQDLPYIEENHAHVVTASCLSVPLVVQGDFDVTGPLFHQGRAGVGQQARYSPRGLHE